MTRYILAILMCAMTVCVQAQDLPTDDGLLPDTTAQAGDMPIIGYAEALESGITRSEIEDRFIEGVRNYVPLQRPQPVIDEDKLQRMAGGLLYMPGSEYMIPEMNRDTYICRDASGRPHYVFSDAYPMATVTNLVLVGDTLMHLMAHIKVLKHEYGHSETLTVPLESLIQYAMASGCTPYWGVEDYDQDMVSGTLILHNDVHLYDHVIRVVCDIDQLSGDTPLVRCSASLYVPIHDVVQLFGVSDGTKSNTNKKSITLP